jgi:small conductance mechanosensitive channel
VPLLAGAGIIGLAISFAAQGLIKDIINGFLIILEDQYAVGDVIVIGDLGGLVESMNLRVTQIRNNEGQLITIPNSAISIVQNLSKEWARVDLSIRIAYDTNPDQALDVLRKLGQEIYQEQIWREKIIEPPEVLGIDDLQHSGMLIRIWIKTQPLQQWSVAREFRRRLKLVLEQENIAIGIPQQAFLLENTFTPNPEK